MKILWKKFNSCYEVSSNGDVRSVDRFVFRKDTGVAVFYKSCPTKLSVHRCGYLVARLSLEGKKKSFYVHRLVAQSFIPNPLNFKQVNHRDGNKQNNSVENLEWCDNGYNQRHAIINGLKKVKVGKEANRFEGTVLAINRQGDIIAKMNGNIEMKNLGFDFRLVSACLLGKRRTHKNCTFVKLVKGDLNEPITDD